MPPLLQELPSEMDHVDRLPDDLLLHVLTYVSSDVHSLFRCSAVSRRFRLLVPLIPSLLIHAECILFNADSIYHPPSLAYDFSRTPYPILSWIHSHPMSKKFRSSVSTLLHLLNPPLHPLALNSPPSLSASSSFPPSSSPSIVRLTPVHAVKTFSNLRTLHIVFPWGEYCLSDDSSGPIRWRAHFGSSLNRCLILAAASTSPRMGSESAVVAHADPIPDSLVRNLGSGWTFRPLYSADKRHRMLRPIIVELTTLESLVIADADGQGVVLMDRDQLQEQRKKPKSESLEWGERLPKIRIWEWFAPVVELSRGVVWKGAMLIAVRPSRTSSSGEEEMGLGWIEEEFDGDGDGDEEGMYAEASRMLVKEKPYYVDWGSIPSA